MPIYQVGTAFDKYLHGSLVLNTTQEDVGSLQLHLTGKSELSHAPASKVTKFKWFLVCKNQLIWHYDVCM